MRAKTKLTRLCSILLTLALLVGLLPTAALAAEPATVTANFKTDPAAALELLNAAKTGAADSTWDRDTNTLTLNGVNFVTSATTAVKLPADSKIVLAAGTTNTITGGGSNTVYCAGINADSLTISGTGTLNVTGGNTTDYGRPSHGIVAQDTLTITGGTVTATGGTADDDSYGIVSWGSLNITGGTVTATGGDTDHKSYGIYAWSGPTITGGTVTATGGNAKSASYGIYTNDVTITGGIVTATGGNVTNGGGDSYGIYSPHLHMTITGGALIAKAGSATNAAALKVSSFTPPTAYWWRTPGSDSYNEAPTDKYTGIGSEAHLEIWNWDPTATADFTSEGDPTKALALLNAAKTGDTASKWEDNTLTLNGVYFATTAATAVQLPAGATIVLADGTTNTIKGGNSGSEDCYGIYVDNGNLTIQGETAGTGKLIVNGGNATGEDKDSYGIRANQGDVTISGGTVEVTGGAATHKSSGIYAKRDEDGSGGYIGGNINISGGAEVTAAGGKVTDATSLSYGLFANEAMTIADSAKVTATGGVSSNRSYGIRVFQGDVTITGTANVTAEGGTAGKKSCGIYSDDGNVTISGGIVKAKAGSVGYSGSAAALNEAPTLTITAYSWRTEESGAYYDPAYSWKENHTYVEIKSNPIVTFDVNGADAFVSPGIGTTNAAGKLTLTRLPEPTRSGYTFKEWNTKQDGTGTTVTSETTFTENTTVYAQWEVALDTITSVAITGIDAPVSNTELDTTAACATTGVSTTAPTVTWTPSDTKAGYGTAYTARVTLTAAAGYAFADGTTATVNGNTANVTKNDDGTLTVTYTFPATAKHNIEITVDTDVRGGDAATNPTISSGYQLICFFVEDTNKNGDFSDDKTWVVDKALVEAFAAQSEGSFTYESLMAALKDEFDLDELKTEFTAGYKYSVYAAVAHGDGAKFAYGEDDIATNAIVKVNGKDITAACKANSYNIYFLPSTDIIVFTAGSTGGGSTGGSYTPPTYKVESTVSKDAGGSVSFSKSNAKKGDSVTITVTPDRYYKVDSVTVKDKNGKEIAVTDNGDGTFTFKMPDSKVAVEPVFSWDNPFGDVAEDTYYAPAVEWALKNEVTDGTSATTFSPDATCTRAQIVTFLWKAAGCPEPAGMSSFTDVSADAYYAKAVAWAVEQGITGGTGGGKFSPDAVCTRSQSMTFIYRSEQAKSGGMQGEWMFQNPFGDVNQEDYYGEAVMWAVANGVTSGTSDTTFSPNATCTRGQIVTFLYRFFVK